MGDLGGSPTKLEYHNKWDEVSETDPLWGGRITAQTRGKYEGKG